MWTGSAAATTPSTGHQHHRNLQLQTRQRHIQALPVSKGPGLRSSGSRHLHVPFIRYYSTLNPHMAFKFALWAVNQSPANLRPWLERQPDRPRPVPEHLNRSVDSWPRVPAWLGSNSGPSKLPSPQISSHLQVSNSRSAGSSLARFPSRLFQGSRYLVKGLVMQLTRNRDSAVRGRCSLGVKIKCETPKDPELPLPGPWPLTGHHKSICAR